HHYVAEQEDPEAEAGHDPLRCGSGVACFQAVQMMWVAMPVGYRHRAHHALPAALTRLRRSSRLARSMRATSAAGMTYSSWSRQANTTKVANAPIPPAITIHQMCQISAKPMMLAKNA